jgi:hypothetical protein
LLLVYVQEESHAFAGDWPQITLILLIPPMYLGLRVYVTMTSLFFWHGGEVLLTICLGWPGTMILLISTSQRLQMYTTIPDLYFLTYLKFLFFPSNFIFLCS